MRFVLSYLPLLPISSRSPPVRAGKVVFIKRKYPKSRYFVGFYNVTRVCIVYARLLRFISNLFRIVRCAYVYILHDILVHEHITYAFNYDNFGEWNRNYAQCFASADLIEWQEKRLKLSVPNSTCMLQCRKQISINFELYDLS